MAAPALAGGNRATPIFPGTSPPLEVHGGTIPGWDVWEFTIEGENGGIVGTVPHSDGLEPPMIFDLVDVVSPLPRLGDNGPVGLDRDNRDRLDVGSTGLTAYTVLPGSGGVSAVPTPGSAVLLIGAAGASALRRRRR